MTIKQVTKEMILASICYCPETGEIRRKVDSYRATAKAGTNPCYPAKNGYYYVSLYGVRFLAHRLAWLLHYGEWPKYQIDHINHDKLDNRISNLRDVPPRVNNENRKKAQSQNKVGLRGVSRNSHGNKWRARITVRGKEIIIGSFESAEKAHQAYLEAKRKLHQGCTI